jgi:hypothetical protein
VTADDGRFAVVTARRPDVHVAAAVGGDAVRLDELAARAARRAVAPVAAVRGKDAPGVAELRTRL